MRPPPPDESEVGQRARRARACSFRADGPVRDRRSLIGRTPGDRRRRPRDRTPLLRRLRPPPTPCRARHGPSGHRHGGHGTAGRDVRRRRRHGPASREQARGRAGDFEIIEYILRGQPGGVPGTWGHHFDDCLLHAPITDQHRNKIAHQAALIESALGSDPADVPSTAPRARHRPPHPADSVRRRRRPAPSRPGSPAPRRPPGPPRRRPRRPPVRPHTPAARDPRPDRRGPLATSCAPPPIWPPTTAPSIWSWPEASSTTSKNASPEP